jgi:hypothetical protein
MLNSSDIPIATHLPARDMEHRIIADPMQFWIGHMPKGMFLKSDGFASSLYYDPGGDFTLRHYCEERNVEDADLGTPVHVEDFCAYSLAFQQRFGPVAVDSFGPVLRFACGTKLTATLSNYFARTSRLAKR